jgi:hypothetical protein
MANLKEWITGIWIVIVATAIALGIGLVATIVLIEAEKLVGPF